MRHIVASVTLVAGIALGSTHSDLPPDGRRLWYEKGETSGWIELDEASIDTKGRLHMAITAWRVEVRERRRVDRGSTVTYSGAYRRATGGGRYYRNVERAKVSAKWTGETLVRFSLVASGLSHGERYRYSLRLEDIANVEIGHWAP